MINSSTPAVRDNPPPPPAEQEQTPISTGNDRSAPSLSEKSHDDDCDDVSQSDTRSDDEQDEQSRRGLKRQWRETAAEAREQDPLVSTPPTQKRQRTAEPAPACETFSRHHDAELITLVRKHGGQVVERHGDFIGLTLPPDTASEFHQDFHLTRICLKLELLRDGKNFAGREAFLPVAFDAFASCLESASLANRPEWVRRLLATGMGKNAGELLRQIADRAQRAGATDSSAAIKEVGAYWAQGDGADTTGWQLETEIRLGGGDRPPENWRSAVRQGLSIAEVEAVIDGFHQGDTDKVLNLLFSPEQRPANGRFFMRTLFYGDSALNDWIIESGAAIISGHPKGDLVIYSTDFNRVALRDKLLALRAAHADGPRSMDNQALLMAAEWGDIDIFQAILAQGAVLDSEYYAARMLGAAAANGAIEIVRCLLALGFPVNGSPFARTAPLGLAAASGHTAICALLLEQGARLERDGVGNQALIRAAASGQTATCAYLLSQGADIEALDEALSALMAAAQHGRLAICRLLLTAGARLDGVDGNNHSVLSLAAQSGNVELYQYLLARGAQQRVPATHVPPLLAAAKANQAAMLTYLLEQGTAGDESRMHLDSALKAACKAGHFEAARVLLSHGASVGVPSQQHRNLLDYAAKSGNLSLFQLIHPLFPRLTPAIWMNALNLAISNNQAAIVQAFPVVYLNPLQARLAPNANPLLAVNYSSDLPAPGQSKQHHEILSFLLARGVPLHHVNEHGNDALILAAKAGDAIAVEQLLHAGMRIQQENEKSKNALDYALANINLSTPQSTLVNSHIFRRLGEALLQQDNRLPLAYDLLIKQTDPLKRDLSMYFYVVQPTGVMDPARLLSLEERVMDQILRPQIIAPDEPYAEFFSELRLTMSCSGITSPQIDVLMPSLQALRQVRDGLFGESLFGSTLAFQAAIDGIYLMLEPERGRLVEQFAAHYAAQPIEYQWKATLTLHSNTWLAHRIEAASAREQQQIASAFSNLFSLCADHALGGKGYSDALKLPAIPADLVALALMSHGIYAALARKIAAAWTEAWQQLASQQASVPVPAPVSGEEEEFTVDLGDDPFGVDAVEDFSNIFTADFATPSNPDSALADTLLTAFRAALKKSVDSPSAAGSLLSLAGASPEALKLYGDLMFRQLHMLAQFIDPERATT